MGMPKSSEFCTEHTEDDDRTGSGRLGPFFSDAHADETGNLWRIGVSPRYCGHGVGLALIDAVESAVTAAAGRALVRLRQGKWRSGANRVARFCLSSRTIVLRDPAGRTRRVGEAIKHLCGRLPNDTSLFIVRNPLV